MPFLMEVTRERVRTVKVVILPSGRAMANCYCAESAQCSDEDMGAFQDIDRHRYIQPNNLWLRLDRLAEALDHNGGLLPLPVIRNTYQRSTRDKKSPPVYQLETAWVQPSSVFQKPARWSRTPGLRLSKQQPISSQPALGCLCDHRRWAGRCLRPSERGILPEIELDGDHFKLVDQLGRRRSLAFLLSCTTAASLPCAGRCAVLCFRSRLRRGDVIET